MYIVEERIAITKWHIKGGNTNKVMRRFTFTFPDSPVPSGQTVLNIFNKLNSRGCLKIAKSVIMMGKNRL